MNEDKIEFDKSNKDLLISLILFALDNGFEDEYAPDSVILDEIANVLGLQEEI